MFTTLITPRQLHDLIEAGEVALFDCGFDLGAPGAGREAYGAGHLPGARYLHLDDDLSGPTTGANGRHPLPDPEAFAQVMRGHGLARGRQVVAYDASGGMYAARLWWTSRWLGHDAVAVLDGGRQAWIAAGYPLETGAAAPIDEGDWAAAARANRIVSADDLMRDLDAGTWRIVDARSPERFRGEPSPLDPVSGHIPGAGNRYFAHNLTETGAFKPPEALAADFDAALAGAEPARAVMQCGSGVTACHNLLALEVAGLPGARLYPGSWSEWIADPARPVARG